MIDHAPRLAITMGDPAGVGPEIIVKACRRLLPRIEAGGLRLLVIGHRSALHAAQTVLNETLAFTEAEDVPLGFLAAGEEAEPVAFGRIAPEAGRFAYLAVERAVELALAGRIDAIVTAPLNKEALNLAGYHFAGHTDMLAALTHTRSSVMLLAHGDMRVGHVTTHVALADVPKLLTPERLRRTIDLTHAAVRDLGIANPRVAVAALNPHAGEGGLCQRPGAGRHGVRQAARAAVRCGGGDVPRPGSHPGQAAGLRRGSRHRHLAGAVGSEHHAGPAGDPHLGRSRHRVRHCREGDRQRGKPHRGDRLRGTPGRYAAGQGLIEINGNARPSCDVNPCLTDRLKGTDT